MTKQNAVDFYNVISNLDAKNTKSNYSSIKNAKILKTEVEVFETLQKPTDKFMQFINARNEVLLKDAKKDANGTPIIDPETREVAFENDEIKNATVAKIKEIEEAHKDVITEQENKQKEINSLLQEESDIKIEDLRKYKLSELPDNLSKQQLDILAPLIEE